ncbi:MAG: hypothetical protein U5K37_11865 [Natrialbaceae archaeon]|nr:hypothetical protein [Natrialbaceae archaeon]
MDIAGNYTIKDGETEEEVVLLDEDFSLFVENWTIRDPDTEEALATIQSKNKLLSALRHLSSIANLVPNKYEIFDPDGNHVGDIEGQFSLRDTYTVSIDDADTVPKEAVVADRVHSRRPREQVTLTWLVSSPSGVPRKESNRRSR